MEGEGIYFSMIDDLLSQYLGFGAFASKVKGRPTPVLNIKTEKSLEYVNFAVNCIIL